MGKVLSQQQIDQYHEQGCIAPIDVMPEKELCWICNAGLCAGRWATGTG